MNVKTKRIGESLKKSFNHSYNWLPEWLSKNIEKISKFCKEHQKEFTFCCWEPSWQAVDENLDDVIPNIKSSHLFDDLELSLQETKKNLNIIRKDRESNLSALDNEQSSW